MPLICIYPKAFNVGGPFSFQQKLSAGLARRGIDVCYDLNELSCDAVLVTGGTKHLAELSRVRRRGIRIVQRLDGINWIHRRRRTGWLHYLRAEYGNFVQAFIRRWLATRIIYQSEFARRLWETRYGPARAACTVVHNGVDLSLFSPEGPRELPAGCARLLVIEGSMGGGYEQGLETTVRLAEELAKDLPLECMVVGGVDPRFRKIIGANRRVPIRWEGIVESEKIPFLERSAHLLYSADIHPACPNAVIEAMACGLPVVAFDTGALSELVTTKSGRVVPYGADPWKLEDPDIPSLVAAAFEILSDLPRFRLGARSRAVEAFDVEKMVDGYLQVLLGGYG